MGYQTEERPPLWQKIRPRPSQTYVFRSAARIASPPAVDLEESARAIAKLGRLLRTKTLDRSWGVPNAGHLPLDRLLHTLQSMAGVLLKTPLLGQVPSKLDLSYLHISLVTSPRSRLQPIEESDEIVGEETQKVHC